MATCGRCGAQNPDGNAYCQACGNALTAGSAVATIPGPPPGPPPGFAAPVYSPAGYQSPYYAPSAPSAPMHRTPWMLVAGAVVALVVVVGGAGTVLAIIGSRNNPGTTSNAVATSQIPSPTPGLIPSPVASPVSTTGSTETNDGFTVAVPPGWTVDSKDNESIVLIDPDSTGSVTVASGGSSPAQSAQQNKSTLDDYFKTNFPDTHNCPNTGVSSTTISGAAGIQWTLCFTVTSGGQSVAAAAWLFAGANPSGSVYYAVMLVTRQTNLQNYLNVVKPVLQSVKWKLT